LPLPPLRIDVTQTIEDYAALTLHASERPAARRARRVQLLTALLAIPVIGLAAHAIAWALDPQRLPLPDALRFLPGLMIDNILPLWLFIGLAILLLALLRKWLIGLTVKSYFAGGGGGGWPVRFVLEDDCLTVDETPRLYSKVAWTGDLQLEETAGHVFVYVDPMRAFIIPKRGIGAETMLEMRERMKAHGLSTQLS
jgi:YcxB-like protein